MLNTIFGSDFRWATAAAAFGVVLAIAWLAAHLAARVARLLLLTLSGEKDAASFRAPIVRRPIRVIWGSSFSSSPPRLPGRPSTWRVPGSRAGCA